MEKSPVLRASFARWGHPSRPDVAHHEQREAIFILAYANRHGKPPGTENRRGNLGPDRQGDLRTELRALRTGAAGRHDGQGDADRACPCTALACLWRPWTSGSGTAAEDGLKGRPLIRHPDDGVLIAVPEALFPNLGAVVQVVRLARILPSRSSLEPGRESQDNLIP